MEENQVQTEINALVEMNQNLTNVPEEVKNAEISSPIASIENGLSKFVNDALDISRQDFAFNDAIQKELWSRLPEMKTAELITLITNNKINDTDRASKIIAPFTNLIANKQQQEIAAMNAATAATNAAAKNGGMPMNYENIRSINESTDKLVQQGMTQLNNLMTMVMEKASSLKTKADAVDVEATTTPSESETPPKNTEN